MRCMWKLVCKTDESLILGASDILLPFRTHIDKLGVLHDEGSSRTI